MHQYGILPHSAGHNVGGNVGSFWVLRVVDTKTCATGCTRRPSMSPTRGSLRFRRCVSHVHCLCRLLSRRGHMSLCFVFRLVPRVTAVGSGFSAASLFLPFTFYVTDCCQAQATNPRSPTTNHLPLAGPSRTVHHFKPCFRRPAATGIPPPRTRSLCRVPPSRRHRCGGPGPDPGRRPCHLGCTVQPL